jgi:MoaA/NifB/PqqE/SkfB family radical SAM enzyme
MAFPVNAPRQRRQGLPVHLSRVQRLPSGFLPIHAGNIRETPLSEIYRNAPIFKSLRDTSKLEG